MLFFLLLVGFAATPAAAEPVYVRQGENVVVNAKDWGTDDILYCYPPHYKQTKYAGKCFTIN